MPASGLIKKSALQWDGVFPFAQYVWAKIHMVSLGLFKHSKVEVKSHRRWLESYLTRIELISKHN